MTRTRRSWTSGGFHCLRKVRNAFTLTELIVLMVIMAILAASAAPALNSFSNSRNTMAARRLLRDMTFARQRAIATGDKTWVKFETGSNRWSIRVESASNPGKANATALTDLATGAAYQQTLGSGSFVGVTLQTASFDAGAEVGFNWLGQPFNASETALAAQGSATISGGHTVTVEVGTGHVRHTGP